MKILKSLKKSNRGKVRIINEDSIYSDDNKGLWIVADGMGGHAAGEIASQLAVNTVSQALNNGSTLESSILDAHLMILKKAEEDKDIQGMGTTIVSAQKYSDGFKVSWVGDSRAYLFNGTLNQLTTDHSFVQDLVHQNIIAPEDAGNHKYSHIITRSLGMEEGPCEVDSLIIYPDIPGCLILLSDGISDFLSTETLEILLNKGKTITEMSENIYEEIFKTEATDNFSYIIIEFSIPSPK